MDIGFVVHVHVFNVHRGSIAFRNHLKTGHDISQSSLWYKALIMHQKLVRCIGIAQVTNSLKAMQVKAVNNFTYIFSHIL